MILDRSPNTSERRTGIAHRWRVGVVLVALAVAFSVPGSGQVARAATASVPSHDIDYIDRVFADVLGRAPTNAELGQATAASMTTRTARRRLVSNVVTSGEWTFRKTAELYVTILGRNPDPAGFGHWWRALTTARVSVEDVEVAFYASGEYARHTTVQEWVGRLYQALLGRPADRGGVAYWAGVARRTGRTTVVRRLAASTEARRHRVAGIYERVLHRGADRGGSAYYTRTIATIGQRGVMVSLAASGEAYGPLRPGQAVIGPPPVPLAAQLAHNGLANRVLTVRSAGFSSTTARVVAWERTVVGWHRVIGPIGAHVGSRGWSRPGQRREGAGTTPAGRFAFATGFGLAANPGYRLGWFRVGPHDYWTSDPTRSDYNTHQYGPANPAYAPWSYAEHLIDHPVAYEYAAAITFNMPARGPYGSAIFLHVSTGGPTAGCVSLPRSSLLAVLRWIDGGTRIVMGPDAVIRSY